MRIFHLSDLHVGARLYNRDLREDQEHIFARIAGMAAEYTPDAILIAGDVYDKSVPAAESVALFDAFLSELTAAAPEAEIMIISGNHDSAQRLNAFRGILAREKVHMIGLPPSRPEDRVERVTLRDRYGLVNFYLLPFVKPSMIKQITGTDKDGNNLSYDAALRALLAREKIDLTERNVLVSHQFYLPAGSGADAVERMDSETRTVGNIDAVGADILAPFDYAALGHIHKPMKVGENYRYCGTPLAYSVSEAEQAKGIVMADMEEKGRVKITVLPLTPLRQVRVIRGELREVLARACGDYVTVILTDRVDLDVIDMQDRLRDAFPYLLEIRRENVRTADYSAPLEPETERDPFELCAMFLKDMDQEEKDLLRDLINTVMEVK